MFRERWQQVVGVILSLVGVATIGMSIQRVLDDVSGQRQTINELREQIRVLQEITVGEHPNYWPTIYARNTR